MHPQRHLLFSLLCLAVVVATTGQGFRILSALALLSLPLTMIVAASGVLFGRSTMGFVAIASALVAAYTAICAALP